MVRLSRLVPARHIRSHHVSSRLDSPRCISSCLVLFRLDLCCPAVSYPVSSLDTTPRRLTLASRLVLSCSVLSRFVLAYVVLSSLVPSRLSTRPSSTCLSSSRPSRLDLSCSVLSRFVLAYVVLSSLVPSLNTTLLDLPLLVSPVSSCLVLFCLVSFCLGLCCPV